MMLNMDIILVKDLVFDLVDFLSLLFIVSCFDLCVIVIFNFRGNI